MHATVGGCAAADSHWRTRLDQSGRCDLEWGHF